MQKQLLTYTISGPIILCCPVTDPGLGPEIVNVNNCIGTTLLRHTFYLVQTVDKFFEMASRSRLSMDDVFQLVDDDAFGLDSGDESDFEGDGVTGYLPAVDDNLSNGADGGGEPEDESEEDEGSGRSIDDLGTFSELDSGKSATPE